MLNCTALKTSFIENRISSVKEDLESSEQHLKEFNEQNRQISSPALQLGRDRLTRDVEVQKNVYLTYLFYVKSKINSTARKYIVTAFDKIVGLKSRVQRLQYNMLLRKYALCLQS